MRRLIAFEAAGETLGGSLDGGAGHTGLLLVTGGSQTRIGSHRMYERLAKAFWELGFICMRFDRRGVGDSSGSDPGFRGSGPDIAAAAAAFRRECPQLERIHGFGLCDGATALALFGGDAGLDGLILANPWLVEADAGEPAPAAVRAHYRRRLLSQEGWKKILSGSVDYRKLLGGVARIVRRSPPSSLAGDVAAALKVRRGPVTWILCEGDNTAIAAEQELKNPVFRGLAEDLRRIASDSHTFARPGDEGRLREAVTAALAAFDQAS